MDIDGIGRQLAGGGGNLWKSQKSWDCLSEMLVREGYSTRVSGMVFKEVVQAVLIFGADM